MFKLKLKTMSKYKVNFGDEFKSCKISLPKTVPVTQNFDNSNVLGFAEVKEENGQVVAEMDIELPNKDFLHSVETSGLVTSREGNLITGFNILSVSFVGK